MSNKSTYIIQDSCVRDIDFPWQLEATKWWIKKYLKKLKALVFGGSGFLGLHLSNVLFDRGYTVTIADLKKPISIKKGIKFIKLDITKKNKIQEIIKKRYSI